jgi:NADPH-dependent curcumin reductase CurA
VIDRVFAMEQAREAWEYLKSGAHFGKVVIRLG